MAIHDYGVAGKSGVTRFLGDCAVRLVAGDTIALRQGSRTAAAIIPWAAVEYLDGEPSSKQGVIVADAVRLCPIPSMAGIGPSGEIGRMTATELASEPARLFDALANGTMVAFIHTKSAVGLFVPIMVVHKLAGLPLPPEGERGVQTGIRNVLRQEEAFRDWRRAPPEQKRSGNVRDPHMRLN